MYNKNMFFFWPSSHGRGTEKNYLVSTEELNLRLADSAL